MRHCVVPREKQKVDSTPGFQLLFHMCFPPHPMPDRHLFGVYEENTDVGASRKSYRQLTHLTSGVPLTLPTRIVALVFRGILGTVESTLRVRIREQANLRRKDIPVHVWLPPDRIEIVFGNLCNQSILE